MLLKNSTGETSRIGYCVKHAPNNPSSFVYTTVNDTSIIGIITQAVPKYAQCEIATIGVTKVFVSESVVQGAIIRSQKSGDRISRGTCKAMKSTDGSYFKIGTALESGKGLISCSLNMSYNGSTGAIANGTYTIGLGIMTDGVITIENGIITGIIEAT